MLVTSPCTDADLILKNRKNKKGSNTGRDHAQSNGVQTRIRDMNALGIMKWKGKFVKFVLGT
jgi:hypothetical protein